MIEIVPLPDRVLSQDEIDKVFRNLRDSGTVPEPLKAEAYDFRRPDRIPKDQLRGIHILHENFARSLASSLSAYLRAYVMVNLVSVEQISFREFSQCLPAPTYTVSLSMRPFEGFSVIEVNPVLVFPIIEMLLGGTARARGTVSREITEIEQSIMDDVLRIVLQALSAAWQNIARVDFSIESHETDPALLQILAPTEALIAIAIEIRVGEHSGMMNIGVPSIFVKMLRQKFDQHWSLRKSGTTDEDLRRGLRLIKPVPLHLDARLQGPTLTVEDLMGLRDGDILAFDYAIESPVDLLVNGLPKYKGHVRNTGRRIALHIDQV
jgi:flagellar motor switch protein FliM